MSVITKLLARQILDSRGNPTLEVTAYSLQELMKRLNCEMVPINTKDSGY
jgi:enolase